MRVYAAFWCLSQRLYLKTAFYRCLCATRIRDQSLDSSNCTPQQLRERREFFGDGCVAKNLLQTPEAFHGLSRKLTPSFPLRVKLGYWHQTLAVAVDRLALTLQFTRTVIRRKLYDCLLLSLPPDWQLRDADVPVRDDGGRVVREWVAAQSGGGHRALVRVMVDDAAEEVQNANGGGVGASFARPKVPSGASVGEKAKPPAQRVAWTAAETSALVRGMKQCGWNRWSAIADLPPLVRRTGAACREKARVLSRSLQCDMSEIPSAFQDSKDRSEARARKVAGVSSRSSMPWSSREDVSLVQSVVKHGLAWTLIALHDDLISRANAACRVRWDFLCSLHSTTSPVRLLARVRGDAPAQDTPTKRPAPSKGSAAKPAAPPAKRRNDSIRARPGGRVCGSDHSSEETEVESDDNECAGATFAFGQESSSSAEEDESEESLAGPQARGQQHEERSCVSADRWWSENAWTPTASRAPSPAPRSGDDHAVASAAHSDSSQFDSQATAATVRVTFDGDSRECSSASCDAADQAVHMENRVSNVAEEGESTSKKIRWTPDETQALVAGISVHGRRWTSISQATGLARRSPLQCSDRARVLAKKLACSIVDVPGLFRPTSGLAAARPSAPAPLSARSRSSAWSAAEDVVLLQGVIARGQKWMELGLSRGLDTRVHRACRRRWNELVDLHGTSSAAELLRVVAAGVASRPAVPLARLTVASESPLANSHRHRLDTMDSDSDEAVHGSVAAAVTSAVTSSLSEGRAATASLVSRGHTSGSAAIDAGRDSAWKESPLPSAGRPRPRHRHRIDSSDSETDLDCNTESGASSCAVGKGGKSARIVHWTDEETAALVNGMRAHGRGWTKIARCQALANRTPASCCDKARALAARFRCGVDDLASNFGRSPAVPGPASSSATVEESSTPFQHVRRFSSQAATGGRFRDSGRRASRRAALASGARASPSSRHSASNSKRRTSGAGGAFLSTGSDVEIVDLTSDCEDGTEPTSVSVASIRCKVEPSAYSASATPVKAVQSHLHRYGSGRVVLAFDSDEAAEPPPRAHTTLATGRNERPETLPMLKCRSVGGVPIFFPEQLTMTQAQLVLCSKLVRGLRNDHRAVLLKSPCGTGKTVLALSALLSFIRHEQPPAAAASALETPCVCRSDGSPQRQVTHTASNGSSATETVADQPTQIIWFSRTHQQLQHACRTLDMLSSLCQSAVVLASRSK